MCDAQRNGNIANATTPTIPFDAKNELRTYALTFACKALTPTYENERAAFV